MRCPICRWKIKYLILTTIQKQIFSYRAKWNRTNKCVKNRMMAGSTSMTTEKWYCPECNNLITTSRDKAYKMMRSK